MIGVVSGGRRGLRVGETRLRVAHVRDDRPVRGDALPRESRSEVRVLERIEPPADLTVVVGEDDGAVRGVEAGGDDAVDREVEDDGLLEGLFLGLGKWALEDRVLKDRPEVPGDSVSMAIGAWSGSRGRLRRALSVAE